MTNEQRTRFARNVARKVAHRPVDEICEVLRQRLGSDAKGLTIDAAYVANLLMGE